MMYLYILLAILILLGCLAGNAFYVAFKKYDDNDDFTDGDTFTFLAVLFDILYFLASKLFRGKYKILVFKIFSFLYGLMIVGLMILLIS